MLLVFSPQFILFLDSSQLAHMILIWVRAPSSHFHNPVLKYFQNSHFYTPYIQAGLDSSHTSHFVCLTDRALASFTFYILHTLLTVSSLQNKENKFLPNPHFLRKTNNSNYICLPLSREVNLIKSRPALKSSVVKLHAVVF